MQCSLNTAKQRVKFGFDADGRVCSRPGGRIRSGGETFDEERLRHELRSGVRSPDPRPVSHRHGLRRRRRGASERLRRSAAGWPRPCARPSSCFKKRSAAKKAATCRAIGARWPRIRQAAGAVVCQLHRAAFGAARSPRGRPSRGAGFSALTAWRMAAACGPGRDARACWPARGVAGRNFTVPPVTASGGAAAAAMVNRPSGRPCPSARCWPSCRPPVHRNQPAPAPRYTGQGRQVLATRRPVEPRLLHRSATTPTATACPAAPPRRFEAVPDVSSGQADGRR